jgi:hypothetical protein
MAKLDFPAHLGNVVEIFLYGALPRVDSTAHASS